MAREKISQTDLNRMAVRGAKVTRQASTVPSPTEVAAAAPPQAPRSAPEPSDSLPFASMQASMDRMGQQLAITVENNTRVIEQFRADMANKTPQPGVAYRHTVNRRRDKLIDYVDSIPMVLVK